MIEINIDPLALNVGISLYWSGIVLVLAGAVLLSWIVWQRKNIPGLSVNLVLNEAIVALVFMVLMARLFHIIENLDLYIADPSRILAFSGLRMWGAIAGATLGVAVYSKIKNIPVGRFLDLSVPGLLLFQAIYRISCLIQGCCHGTPTSLPWGVIYTRPDSPAYLASLNLPVGIGLHPVPVYEIVFCLIFFAVILKLRSRLKPAGSLFLLFISLYAVWRLSTDFLRDGTPFIAGLTQAQLISILVLVTAIPLLLHITRKPHFKLLY